MPYNSIHKSFTLTAPGYLTYGSEVWEYRACRFGGVMVRYVEPDYQGPWAWGVSISKALPDSRWEVGLGFYEIVGEYVGHCNDFTEFLNEEGCVGCNTSPCECFDDLPA